MRRIIIAMPVSAATVSMPMTQAIRRDVDIPMQAEITAAANAAGADSKTGGVMPPFCFAEWIC